MCLNTLKEIPYNSSGHHSTGWRLYVALIYLGKI